MFFVLSFCATIKHSSACHDESVIALLYVLFSIQQEAKPFIYFD